MFYLDVMDFESVRKNMPREEFDIVYDMLVLAPDHIKERLTLLNCDRYIMVSSAEYMKSAILGFGKRSIMRKEKIGHIVVTKVLPTR